MQNVHTRGNIRGNLPLFGQNAGFLPYLDKAGHICYIFHRFPARSRVCGSKPVFSIPMEHLSKTRVCALCAQRRSAPKAPAGFPALLFYYLQTPRRGLLLVRTPKADPFFLAPPLGELARQRLRGRGRFKRHTFALSVIAAQCHLSQRERLCCLYPRPTIGSPFGGAGKAEGFD